MGEGAPIRVGASRRSRRAVLGAAVCVAAGAALAIGAGLAAVIARSNGWPLDRDVLLLAGQLTLLYLGINLILLGAVSGLLLLLGLRPGLRALVAIVVAGYVLLNGLQRFIPSVQLLSVAPHLSAIGAVDLGVVFAAALCAGLAVASRRLPRAAGLLGLAAALLVGLGRLHGWHERPLVRDLAQDLPRALSAAPVRAAAPAAERFESARLVLLGFDGLSWEVLLPLLRRGELPSFRALLADSAWGYLETLPFAVSPVVWETIATGQPPERHGIGHHVHFAFPGVSRKVRVLPSFALTHSPMRVRGLLSLASRVGGVRQLPAESSDAQAARFWEIASRAGVSVGVYDWLNTSPATPVRGFLHGYGPVEPRVFPGDLEAGIPPLPANPASARVGIEWVLAKQPYEQATYLRFRHLALQRPSDVLLYYTHFPDAVNHVNWKPETWGDRLLFSGLRHPEIQPGHATSAVMRWLDAVLGDVMARLPESALLAVVSDHGFDFRGYEHDNGPPGVILLRGPGVKPGPLPGRASVYDVTPTLLTWLGLPLAEDMAGAPLLFDRLAVATTPPAARVASYGRAGQPLSVGRVAEESLHQHEQYLRSLGYVK
jgi:predicted AlkP superfamily phosphohydrolase/phosphomutase